MRTISKAIFLGVVLYFTGVGVIDTTGNPFHKRHTYHGITVIQHTVHEEAEDASARYWKIETARRFPDAVIIIGHGGYVGNIWTMRLDDHFGVRVPVEWEVKRAQAMFPDRTIVLCVCNANGTNLGMKNVYHAQSLVWFVPDKAIPDLDPDDQQDQLEAMRHDADVVGNIFEFDDD